MTLADSLLDIFDISRNNSPMSYGSKPLTNDARQRLVQMWQDDSRYGSRYQFASRLAEIVYGTSYPPPENVKAIDKRLERLQKNQTKLTNSTSNAIAKALGISPIDLEQRLFGSDSKKATVPVTEYAGGTYRHFEVIHEYDIQDTHGHITKVKTAERVQILKQEVREGGSFWSARPNKLEAFYKHVGDSKPPWENTIPLEINRIEKEGKNYRWDTYHAPALLRGENVWFLTSFELKDEFTSTACSDVFHSMEPIESFTWKIKFPIGRPVKRWWITTNFHPQHSDGATLVACNTPALIIEWSTLKLPKGVFYTVNWVW